MGDTDKFKIARFCAWDGEGVTRPVWVDPYTRQHDYTLLAYCFRHWEGDDWYYDSLQSSDHLSTLDCLDFMIRASDLAGKNTIHVGFSLSYDFTHILRDLSPHQLERALVNSDRIWGYIGDYAIKVRPRKDLRVIKYHEGQKVGYIHLWDTFGFFQSSFVEALKKWVPEYKSLARIMYGKRARAQFINWSPAAIEQYNFLELKGLVLMMNKLHAAFSEVELVLSRWDGAGAAAAAAYKKHMKKGWFGAAQLPDDVYLAAQGAYYGGRIEIAKFGTHAGYLWTGDINSAYPAGMAHIPDLTNGHWRLIERPGWSDITEFSLVLVSWNVGRCTFGPFPFRMPDGRVLFPRAGKSWVWGAELIAFQQAAGYDLPDKERYRLSDCQFEAVWVFEPGSEDRPFAWVSDLYDYRQTLIRAGSDGAQKALKLAINALYGKTVQQVGYQPQIQEIFFRDHSTVVLINEKTHRPPFYNLAVGGFITAFCRAELLRVAAQNPGAVCALATDSIMALQPLVAPTTPGQKRLGEWTIKEIPAARYVLVQAGVYYLHDGQHWTEHSRGFFPCSSADQSPAERDQHIEKRLDQIMAGWRAGQRTIYFETERLIGLRAALAGGPDWWARRGCWYRIHQDDIPGRRLSLVGQASKRTAHMGKRTPAERLINTSPNDVNILGDDQSIAYKGLPLPDEFIQQNDLWDDLQSALVEELYFEE